MKITESEGEMTIEKINWFEKAVQAWCHESTKHVDMIPELAMVFALMLKEQHDRLTAECQKWQEWHDCEYRERKKYRQDANYFAGEVDRLRAELKEREGEVERLRDMIADSHDELLQKFDSNAVGHTDLYTWIKCILEKIERLKSLAASRLADQEAIERHVTERVAREILLIMDGSESYENAVSEIRKKYEVD